MKILFISQFILADNCGAKTQSIIHYKTLRSIVGSNNIDVVALSSNKVLSHPDYFTFQASKTILDRFKNFFEGNTHVANNKIINKIIELIDKRKYDVVFFDDTWFGNIMKRINAKSKTIKLYVFAHGVMFNQSILRLKNNLRDWLAIPQFMACIYNEYLTTCYADKMLVLNDRDNDMLKKFYHYSSDLRLPVCFDDTADLQDISLVKDDEVSLLFVGGYFWPNVLGLKWFAKKVMPHLEPDIRLYVIGNNMELLRRKNVFVKSDSIIIVGSVDNLTPWYNMAHIVIAPIFHGEGMKTKTAEAFMHGKSFLGTPEALCGYSDTDAYVCKTAEDFIGRINDYYHKSIDQFYNPGINPTTFRFNKESKDLYERYYSRQTVLKVMKSIVNDMDGT